MRMARQFAILLAREVESLFLSPLNNALITNAHVFNGLSL